MTICAVLNKKENQEKIYNLLDSYDVEGSKKVVIEILEEAKDKELKDNPDVNKAIDIFKKCKNQNQYLSTLGTYMTCINV